VLKGLHAPFKAVLKIALLDKYTQEDSPPLCELYKRELFSGPATGLPDPYLCMVESVRSFCHAHKQDEVLRLLEECFLIKSLLTSGLTPTVDGPRLDLFFDLGARWGWSREEIKDQANFRNWDYQRVEELRQQIMAYLLATYKKIRERTAETAVLISNRDLTVIGKKLACFFETKPGKIPYAFTLVQSSDISILTLEEQAQPDGSVRWRVCAKVKGRDASQFQPLHTAESLLLAMAWCSLNQVCRDRQQLMVKGRTRFPVSDAVHFIRAFGNFLPIKDVSAVPADGLLEAPRITHLYALANWGKPEWNHGIVELSIFHQNSHGELCFERAQGERSLEWLEKIFFAQKVGKQNAGHLIWKVYSPREVISNRKKLCEQLAKHIEGIIRRQ
jgi:adenylate cyclase